MNQFTSDMIGVVPYLNKTLKMGGVERGDNGLSDSTLLGRYQVFQLDRPGETFRAQVLGGLKFPTGLNGIWAERNKLDGGKVGDSGGYTLFVSPGLQYVTRRWVAEISVQLPIVQELNGNQLKTDYILNAGFRIQF